LTLVRAARKLAAPRVIERAVNPSVRACAPLLHRHPDPPVHTTRSPNADF